GENVPANVAQLQEQVRREGEQALRFYILFLLGFMSGLGAGHGSRFLNAKRAENVIEAIRMLQHLLKATPRGIYW
ncbi:CNGA3, partial [Symbiodinium pilosum]